MKNDRFLYLLAVILFAAVVIAYSNHFNNSFHFDDSHTIVDNVFIRDIGNIPLFFKDGTTFSSLPTNQSYRPVVTTTLAIDYWLGKGLNPFFFHLSTFVFFIIQGLLMYFLFIKIFDLSDEHPINKYIALIAVAWYLLHPANAETINYVIARSDSLSTLFVILSLVLFMYSSLCRKWHLYLVPFSIAVLTKPIAVIFVPLLLVYILLFETKKASDPRVNKKGHVLYRSIFKILFPSLLTCVILLVFIKAMSPKTWIPGGTSHLHYVITQPYVIFHYFTTFFLPLSLSADTDWKPLASVIDVRFFAGVIFVLALLFFAIMTSKKEQLRPISFGIYWFFIALFPTSSIFPLAEVMNDHRIFFPFVGLVMSVCWATAFFLLKLKNIFSSELIYKIILITVISFTLSAYAYGTYQRNKVWKTDKTLWKDVIEKSPANGRGLMNYGLALMAKADYPDAEIYFRKALELYPDYPYLYVNIGVLKEATGNFSEAEQYFKKAILYGPGYPECYFYYGKFLKAQRRFEEASWNLNKALELLPAHMKARQLLMDIYYLQGDFGKLSDMVKSSLQLEPSNEKSRFYLAELKKGKTRLDIAINNAKANKTPEGFLELSLQYYEAGQYIKSIEAAKEALKLRPGYDLAYNNICAAYNELKQWDKAIEAGEKAVNLNPSNQLAKNNLAWAKKQKTIVR